MSNTDGIEAYVENEAEQMQQAEKIKLTPLYQQFTYKIFALLLTVASMVGLLSILFYHNNVQNNALIDTQLVPLTQELKQINALQQADQLIADLLLPINAERFVELHADLVAINSQLLQQNSSNGQTFQQWLNTNKLAEDNVSRIQDSHTRNQQLKQSSIIQLQLILLSITPLIDNQLAHKVALHNQLESTQSYGRVEYTNANEYAKSVQQVNDLQQLKMLLTEVLLSVEHLSMHTSTTAFEHLRLQVEKVFSLYTQVNNSEEVKAMVDIHQQFETFEKIALTEQRALAKWQGYIRLAQSYQLDLKAQQQKIKQLLLIPHKYDQASGNGVINVWLAKLNIELSNNHITILLIVAVSFSLLVFCFLLWRLREQIKVSAQQGVEVIKHTLQTQEIAQPEASTHKSNFSANCSEIQDIMNQVLSIAKPQHNDDEFQKLLAQNQSAQQLLMQQEKELAHIAQCNEQQLSDAKAQRTVQLNDELQRYQLLEQSVLPIIQQQQMACFNQTSFNEKSGVGLTTRLTFIYQKLAQFRLASSMKSEKSLLKLSDINLIDEMHAILFNKQREQLKHENQLFISFDEQLLRKAKVDFTIFQQLIDIFIDIALNNCQSSQLLLQVQLQDKNAGQQLVHFSAKVNAKSIDTLPAIITTLVDSQTSNDASEPLIDVFNVLFAKQHGENIVAQLSDDGYQLSFELPLAIAASANNKDKLMLDSASIMLLSSNTVLAELIEKSVLSAKGKFDQLTRIDSFQQHLTEKSLKRRKLDVLVVASDIAVNHYDLVIQQINNLPHSLQPKLMILQSNEFTYEQFGFYSQAEQVFCKETFLQNILILLENKHVNNELFSCESFRIHQYLNTALPLLLAVNDPQKHQNLQRLLHWLGFQVQVVANEVAQQALWATGLYSILITEFAETALIEMAVKPVVNVGVITLTEVIPDTGSNAYFEAWHIDKLAPESTLTALSNVLSPWLRQKPDVNEVVADHITDDELELLTEDFEELVITEVAQALTENGNQATFDFPTYLKNQGSVELALFMMDEYTQDNHQLLDALIESIKAESIEKAKLSLDALTVNAKILAAPELQLLCSKWSILLNNSETLSNLKKVESLLENTRIALTEIDEYAEAI